MDGINNRKPVFGVHSHRTDGLHLRYLHRDSNYKESDTRGNTLCLRYSAQMSRAHLRHNKRESDFGRFRTEMWQNSLKIQQKCVTINSRHPLGGRPIRITWHRHTHQQSDAVPQLPVRTASGHTCSYECLPLLHNSGHHTKRPAIKSQISKLEIDIRTDKWRVGQVHRSYKHFECRTASLCLVPQILPARPSVKSTKYENKGFRIVAWVKITHY